jgi:fucose 4-O-acetylase-like acetyltransferase
MEKGPAIRDSRLDCAKGALMVLVVFGHVLEVFTSRSCLYTAVCSAIYIFHMPLFVMIGGMFAKAMLREGDYAGMFRRLVVPLAIFQFLYLGMIFAKSGHLPAPVLQPHWILWFLLSMFAWKLALPVFNRLPSAVLLSAAMAIAAGFDADIGYALSLSRTIYFFPFFLIGHFYRNQITLLASRFRGLLSAGFAVVVAGVVVWSFHGLPHDALYGSKSYLLAPVMTQAPAIGRGLVLVLSLVASIAFLGLVPVKSRLLEYLGERSLSIFLLHGFVVMMMSAMVRKFDVPPAPVLLSLWFAFSVIIALATAPFEPWLMRVYEIVARQLQHTTRAPNSTGLSSPALTSPLATPVREA